MVDTIVNFFMGGAAVAPPVKVVDRINVLLENEQCILRLEYTEGLRDVVNMQLFSLDNGIFGTRYEHTNLSDILSSLKTYGYTVNYNEDKTKVTFHLGPRGLLPIVLEKYAIHTTENDVQLLSEEVRRLAQAHEEAMKENERLRERLDKLEKMVTPQAQSG